MIIVLTTIQDNQPAKNQLKVMILDVGIDETAVPSFRTALADSCALLAFSISPHLPMTSTLSAKLPEIGFTISQLVMFWLFDCV